MEFPIKSNSLYRIRHKLIFKNSKGISLPKPIFKKFNELYQKPISNTLLQDFQALQIDKNSNALLVSKMAAKNFISQLNSASPKIPIKIFTL